MSDFLERLAARAIGNDAALAPRLPSLFEPSQKVPILPLTDAGEVPSRGREAVPATAAVPVRLPVPPTNAASTAERSTAPITPADPTLMLKPAPAAVQLPSDPQAAPAARPAPLPTPTLEPLAAIVTAETPAATRPVSPRQTRIAPERRPTAPQSAAGSLRPAPGPVFGTTRASPAAAPSVLAAARRAPATSAGSGQEASPESVVHVSIGRLEVRAAAATGTAPRRRDDPRPASLDDYLRQRGDKVSP